MISPGQNRSALGLARGRLAAGDIDGASRQAAAIVSKASDSNDRAGAYLVLAACCEKRGETQAALANARAATLAAPGDAVAHYAYAELQEATGDTAGAKASLERALAIQPAFVQAHHYLGILRGETGDTAGAISSFEATVRLDPDHARAWNNLGNAQRTLGRLEEAEKCFARAVALKPDYSLAAANLGGVQRDLGEVVRAEQTLRTALARLSGKPTFRPIVVLLAGLLRERGSLDEAAQLYMQAIKAAPQESGGEWFNLGWVLTERGQPEQARDAYLRARAVDRSDLRNLFARHLTLPMIYTDANALQVARDGFAAGLEALEEELPRALEGLPEEKLLDGLRWTNFFLAYQGRDDRALQERYAALLARVLDAFAPRWRAPMASQPRDGRRIRIGFASAFFHVGTCGRYFKSWITDLDRARFEVFIYHLWPGTDEVAAAIAHRADHFRVFGGSRARPSVVAPTIRADRLDILVYPELGMDVTSFALAALRLAPLQCAGWGHPMTTGHATIDAFFSCQSMESDEAQRFYSEKLIMLPGIGTRYHRLDLPAEARRHAFGLPEDRVLLLCPQSLFKIHPDNDALFAQLLTAHAKATLVFFAGRHPAITDQFMRRLARTFDAHGVDTKARVCVIPQIGHDDYLRVNRLCDAMVDTLHWSGGNTSLDALACGLPIVTLPGNYMRGRQSAGMLTLLGVPELIASDREDYLAIASRLVDDAQWRHDLSERICAAQDCLFDRSEPVTHLHHWLQETE